MFWWWKYGKQKKSILMMTISDDDDNTSSHKLLRQKIKINIFWLNVSDTKTVASNSIMINIIPWSHCFSIISIDHFSVNWRNHMKYFSFFPILWNFFSTLTNFFFTIHSSLIDLETNYWSIDIQGVDHFWEISKIFEATKIDKLSPKANKSMYMWN